MRFKGFIGPAYTLKSVNIECQRCVNLYPEIIETGTGKEGEIAYLKSTPGLTKLLTVGNGPIRGIFVDPQDRIFVASGNKMYKLAFSGSVWSALLLGTLNTSNGSIKAASNLTVNDSATVFVDGTDSYIFKNVASVETFSTFVAAGYIQVAEATDVYFIDGYFVYNKTGSSQFYVSAWGDFNVDPLSFASGEGDPDNIVGIIANHRMLYLLSEQSAEAFMNTGNADFPFERLQGGFIEKGCVATHSIAKVDGMVFWLGRDHAGQGIVYAAQNLVPQRISTHAIEQAIQGYANIATADAFTYSSGGHSFYVLSFPEATWVFDLTTKLWHERAYSNDGILERHRGSYCVFIPQYGIHLVGDYENNKIYQFDDDVNSDDNSPIIKMRSSPHVTNSLKRLFCNSFQLDMEIGVGLDGDTQGADPQVMMDFSDDGGHTWSNESWVSAGGIGKYKARAIWRRLGAFRDRVFRVKISDPVKVVLMGAELDIIPGAH